MPLVSVTFDVVLTPEEIQALQLVAMGLTDYEIAKRMQTTTAHVERTFSEMRLDAPLNLVQALRGRKITLRLSGGT